MWLLCINLVKFVMDLPAGVIAIAEINEALNSGDPEKTLTALLLPTAKIQGVNPATAKHYHDLLLHTKDLICTVRPSNLTQLSLLILLGLPVFKCGAT